MNFDTIIIGGGLSGLLCGITLQQQGQRCAIITAGQSAIDFSSGSIDLLSYSTLDRQVIKHHNQGISTLDSLHPYHLIGAENVEKYSQQFFQLANQLNLGLKGELGTNHYRITPIGSLQATWLSPTSVPTLALDQEKYPYSSIMLLGIEGYHDFQPQLMADNLKTYPQFADCDIRYAYLNIPELDHLRANSREFRSVNISQALEHKLNFAQLVTEIIENANNAEAVFLPACFGLNNQQFFSQLQQATGLALFEIPTLPPSLLGLRQHYTLKREFERLGGMLMQGDKVISAEIEQYQIQKIYTARHEDMALSAKNYVLASGSFFSNGLKADFNQIIEPIFNLDVIADRNRLAWTNPRFSRPQPYHRYGLKINSHCQTMKNDEVLANLFAIGAVLGGCDPLAEGCGSGVAIVTALHTANQILNGAN